MPIRKLCSSPNCNEFAITNSIYCIKHKQESDKKRTMFRNAVRYNESLYNTSEWKKLRKKHLKYQPYCISCGIGTDLQVDHIIPPRGNPDLFFDEYNLQTLCRSCHTIKTAKECYLRLLNK